MVFTRILACSCLLFFLANALVGCTDSGGPDPKVEAKRLESAKSMRSYFDQSKGDFTRLSETDKQAFIGLFEGDKARAQSGWEHMKYGAGGRPGNLPPEPGFQ